MDFSSRVRIRMDAIDLVLIRSDGDAAKECDEKWDGCYRRGPASLLHGGAGEELDCETATTERRYTSREEISTRMKNYSFTITCLAVLVCANVPGSDCLAQPAAPEPRDTVHIAFLSDTQEPIFYEKLFLGYERNLEVTSVLIGEICSRTPRALIHLGDLVAIGSDDDRWTRIDTFSARLRRHGIEFLATPGNHEYVITTRRGMANFTARFPKASLIGISRQYGNTAVVLVNSNVDELSDDERLEQEVWYRNVLRKYDEDPTVDFIVVGCHHSPFTNSKWVSASEDVREAFLPAFIAASKCRVFVSGHSHSYEEFRSGGKDFLVIGGGGGSRHRLLRGARAEYEDRFDERSDMRPFHFVSMKAWADTLQVNVNMLSPDLSRFDSISRLTFVAGGSTRDTSRTAVDDR